MLRGQHVRLVERTMPQTSPRVYKNSVGLYSWRRGTWKQVIDQGPWSSLAPTPICSRSIRITSQNHCMRSAALFKWPHPSAGKALSCLRPVFTVTYWFQNFSHPSYTARLNPASTCFIRHIPTNAPGRNFLGSSFTCFALALRVGMRSLKDWDSVLFELKKCPGQQRPA